jgi:feruloyl esterase
MIDLAIPVLVSSLLAATPCGTLKSIVLPDTTITFAEMVPAGPYTAPAPTGAPPLAAPALGQTPAVATPGGGRGGRGGAPAAPPIMLPAHCRVAAMLKPSPDSAIEMEVWLPAEHWNGKFQAVGNGGWAGVISYAALASALQEGYATASTDTGHKGGDASFALGHPEKLVDFAYRAVHDMTVTAKAIVTAFYDRGPRLSYWNGCSTGGRQALMEAQRFPQDFDGIIAGAPANYRTNHSVWSMSVGVAALIHKENVIPPAKLDLLHKAVVNACDALDGVKDGLLADPRQCHFDPSTLLCRAGEADTCLTAPQVETAKHIYGPLKTKTGELVFPGMEPGSELGWTGLIGGPDPLGLALTGFKYTIHEDPTWDWRTFDLDRDLALSQKKMAVANAIDPDLQAFKARGGKLLMYHGWNDQLIPPENSINYYSSVLAKMGSKQDNFVRLFMAPGMQHCGGGAGPSQINYMAALERWRESNTAPDQLIASRVVNNRVDMTRPLCPYPHVARYKGVGSTNDAANFVCRVPARVNTLN